MEHLLEAQDMNEAARQYIHERYGEAVLWSMPWIVAELISKLVHGFTQEMCEEWLLVRYSISPLA